jgi:CheY-like chemotaxis protein
MLEAEYTAGGHRRFLIPEIKRFAAEHSITLHGDTPDELRILVVDDDEQMARYLIERLSLITSEFGLDFQSDIAADGFDAGVKVFRFRPHIILLDLLMPGMDGFEVCRGLKDDPMTRDIRVIALTAFASDDNVNRIISAGAEACLKKPIDHVALVAALGLKQKRTGRARRAD